MNRVAISFSGQVRTAKSCYGRIKEKIIDQFENVDIFISTWNHGHNIMAFDAVKYRDEYISHDELIDTYKPTIFHSENFDDFKSMMVDTIGRLEKRRNYPETNMLNMTSMYYKIWKANSLKSQYEKDNNIKYDLVIRMRFDQFLDDTLYINFNELSGNRLYIPDDHDYRGGVRDSMAWGNSKVMDIYSNLFPEIDYYINDELAPIHPESILRYHLERHELFAHRPSYNYSIMRLE